jgi:HEPN domain-containing protein
MDSASDAEYRLRLARGFLAEAEEDLGSSRWRSCVDNSQLTVENAAKSVIARFGPVPRSHDMSAVLSEHLRRGAVPSELREGVEHLQELSRQLGFEEHVRSDYGDEARGITPWELFQEADAQRAIEIARRAVNLAGRLGG